MLVTIVYPKQSPAKRVCFGSEKQPRPASTIRKRVVAKQSRREGVYNRTGDLSVLFCEKEEQRNERTDDFSVKRKSRRKRCAACDDVEQGTGVEPA